MKIERFQGVPSHSAGTACPAGNLGVSTHGGQQITISGTDFTGATEVTFGGTPAVNFNVVSATEITATTPPEAAGTVDVTVTTAGGTSALSTADELTYAVPAPVITGVNGGAGDPDGGTPVVLTGTDLGGATQVLFGATPALAFTVVSNDEIVATAPAGTAAGTVDITVTTPSGTSALSPADQFSYAVPAPVITGLSSSSGAMAGGQTLVITGTNLSGVTAVNFGMMPATSFVAVSDNEIDVTVPAGLAGTVNVSVTTASGSSAASSASQYQYTPPPNNASTATSTAAAAAQTLAARASGEAGFMAASPVAAANPPPHVLPATASASGSANAAAAGMASPALAMADGDGYDGSGSSATSTAAVSSSSWFDPNTSSSGTSRSGHTLQTDTWGYHYKMIVTAGDSVISSYIANGGGQSSDMISWNTDADGIRYGTVTGQHTSWSSVSFSSDLVSTVSSGTKGSNGTTETSSNTSRGQQQSHGAEHGSLSFYGGAITDDGATSAQSGSGTSSGVNGVAGSYTYTMPGGNSSGNWDSGSNVKNGYTDDWHRTLLGSDGIWLSTATMSNYGSGTSYASLSGRSGYSLTSGSSSAAGSGHDALKQSGGWSYQENEILGTASVQVTGAQSSNSARSSSSSSRSNSNVHATTADSKAAANWSHSFSSKGSGDGSASSTLGSDGLWQTVGSTSMQRANASHNASSDDDTFATDEAAGSSSTTDAGGSMSSSTSGSSSSSSAASTLNNGTWTPISGRAFSGDHGQSKDSDSAGGDEKVVAVGDNFSSPWSDSASGNANYSTTVTSVLNAGGLWLTTGTSTEGGNAKDSEASSEAGKASSGSSSGIDTTSGSLTIKEAGKEKSSDGYGGEQTLTQGGGWRSVTGFASSASSSSSSSSSNSDGASDSTTADGDSDDDWSEQGKDQASFSGQVNAKLGSDGVWVTSGSVVVAGSGSGSGSYGDKAKYQLAGAADDDSGTGTGSGSDSSSSSNGWDTSNDTSSSGSSSSSTSHFNARYSLGASGSWNAVSGSAVAQDTSSSKDLLAGKGDFGSILVGGSDAGSWNTSGNGQSSNTVTVNSILGSNGVWTTTGTDTGSDSGIWSSGFQSSGAFTIDTGTVGSGNWSVENAIVTESDSNKGGSSDNYTLSLASNGTWQVASGSASANDAASEDVSDDETDNYGEATGSGEVSGNTIENDSLAATASANDTWTLGTDGTWTLASSSLNATDTVNNTLGDAFSGGSIQSASSQDSLQETLSSNNGGTPVVTALTETASGSFTANGTPATFSINVSGSPSTPTTTITETNTTDLNGLSVSTDDLDSLDSTLVAAIAEGGTQAPNPAPQQPAAPQQNKLPKKVQEQMDFPATIIPLPTPSVKDWKAAANKRFDDAIRGAAGNENLQKDLTAQKEKFNADFAKIQQASKNETDKKLKELLAVNKALRDSYLRAGKMKYKGKELEDFNKNIEKIYKSNEAYLRRQIPQEADQSLVKLGSIMGTIYLKRGLGANPWAKVDELGGKEAEKDRRHIAGSFDNRGGDLNLRLSIEISKGTDLEKFLQLVEESMKSMEKPVGGGNPPP